MTDAEQDLLTTPIGFAEGILGLKLYDWQAEVLAWYDDPRHVTMGFLSTPNGAGKSSGVVAALSLWWAFSYPKSKVIITSASSLQIEQQLYPALEAHREKLLKWKWVTSPYTEITSPSGSTIVAHTTNDPGKAEGHHPAAGGPFMGPVLMIVDEAKSVDEEIFQAIDRCTYQGLLYVSSPGLETGRFFKAAKSAQFKKRVVSLRECPHINKQKIDRMISEYGEQHPLVRSSIYGEFMQEGDVPMVFPRSCVNRTLADPPQRKRGSVTLFCDFAAGGDENVIAKCEGNVLSIEHHWRETDTNLATMTFILKFKQLGVQPWQIFGDNGGIGKSMVDSLHAAGWDINRVDNQKPPFDRNYMNRGAEMWHETAGAMRRGEIVLGDGTNDDEALRDQLCSRRARFNEQGKLGVEKKEDMKARGIPSPDRADAICGAWANSTLVPMEPTKSVFEEYAESHEEDSGKIPLGADPG